MVDVKGQKLNNIAPWIGSLRATGFICHLGSHSFTCHPTQVNTDRLNPSQTGRYSIYLSWRDGRLSWPTLVAYRDGLTAHTRSPIQLQTPYSMAWSWTRNLLITSPTA